MKPTYRQYLFAFLLLSIFTLSCKNRSLETEPLSISESELMGVSQNGDALKVIVTSSSDWEAVTEETWLVPNVYMGSGRTIVTVRVKPNLLGGEREGRIDFKSGSNVVSLVVKQMGGDVEINNYVYEIPLIFHVLYNETERREKNLVVINSERLQDLLNYVNERYAGITLVPNPDTGKHEAEKVNVRFVLATHDPQGKLLSPSGINNVTITEKALDPYDVMESKNGERFHQMAYPLHSYINVYIFPFQREATAESITLGIAHFPHINSGYPLAGLSELDYRVDKISNYNHSIVINAEQFEPSFYDGRGRVSIHKQNTAASTLAHELGHYLGLYHTFAEEIVKEGNKESIQMLETGCEDSDYCADTRSYNRVLYDNQLAELFTTGTTVRPDELITGLLRRTDCNKEVFTSYNVMDYEYSHNDRFSPEQVARMRHVLYYSPVVPGEKLVTHQAAPRTMIEATPRVAVCAVGLHSDDRGSCCDNH